MKIRAVALLLGCSVMSMVGMEKVLKSYLQVQAACARIAELQAEYQAFNCSDEPEKTKCYAIKQTIKDFGNFLPAKDMSEPYPGGGSGAWIIGPRKILECNTSEFYTHFADKLDS